MSKADKDLLEYRNLLQAPKEFKEGFGWSTVAGIIFCGLVMLPGSIYLGLMTGAGMGSAATWVTLILFSEIARRSLKTMNAQELVVLLRAAGIIMAADALLPGGPLGGLVYRAFLVTSDAIRDAGMRDAFPAWFCPPPDSPAIANRELMHADWLIPVVLLVFCVVVGTINRFTLGYALFRLTSDVEKLPYPMAPIQAQGALALADADAKKDGPKDGAKPMAALKPGDATGSRSPRWRQFSLGAAVGIAFGMLQVGIPAVTGLFLERPLFLLPQPFIDLTRTTEGILPATPTGLTVDLGIVLLGFILPFWAVVGTFCAIALTMVLNPILFQTGVLHTWKPGMDTVNTTFANSVDFWMSFGIGAGLAIAVISIYSTIRDVRAKLKEIRAARAERGETTNLWAVPAGRGDYPVWIALAIYGLSASATVAVSWYLLPKSFGMLAFLVLFAFVYSPLMSYVNARLLGISGQSVDIPFVKETAFILSGAKGIAVWLAPIPLENHGGQAQALRVNELTGVRFWSLIKTELIALPILILLSFVFWAFIWKANAVPSDAFPAAQINWELRTKNDALLYTSTFMPPGETETSITDSEFMRAIHPKVIAVGFGGTTIAFIIAGILGLPTLLIYGFIRGLGQFPHVMMLEIVGAMLGRFYLERRFGRDEFRRTMPTVLAGYFTGVGLIGMATIALKLIQQAVLGGGL
jgi:hypothetical protein